MNRSDAPAIGIDLGGTKVLAALVDPDGRAQHHAKAVTPTEGPASVAEAVADVVTQVVAAAELTAAPALGIGVPGPVVGSTLMEAPNLEGFTEPIDVGALLADVLEMEVAVGNDANVGTLGEARHGAAVGSTDVLGVWLGTGVGGGLVLDGKLRQGPNGVAAEIGHVPVVLEGGLECGCGRLGCVEAYAGRASMEAQVRAAIADGQSTAMQTIMVEKGKDRFTSGVWKKALAADDPLAVSVVDRAIQALAVAIAGIVNTVDVQRIVFGGGLAEKLGQPLVDRIAEAAAPRLMAPTVEREWLITSLGDDAGVIGAAALAREA